MGCGVVADTKDVLKPQLQFTKLQSIHKNQQAEIWTCVNQKNQKFSIKVFKKIHITQENSSMLKNFQHEINRLYGLTEKNPNQNEEVGKHLMPYLRAWKDENGNLSLIMKHIDSNSLGDQIRGKLPGVFTQQRIAKFTSQILWTVKYLRKNSSIFCNIKPTNLFLDKAKENVILTDYYNLEEYFHLTQNNIFTNPIYSAPENVLFNQYFQETDIWRVGCFVVEMLTCIKPWYQETMVPDKIIQNLKNMKKPPIPQKVSSLCKNFLQKCFETDHNRRTSLEELLHHGFLTQNLSRTQIPGKVNNQRQNQQKYQRQNSEMEQIASYNFEVQIIQQTPRRESHSKKLSTEMNNFEQFPSRNTLDVRVPRKKTTSNYVSAKTYETAKIIVSQNDENYCQSTVDMRKSKEFRSKRIKTQTSSTKYVSNSPYAKKNNHKQILSLFNKKKNPKLLTEPINLNDFSISRKISNASSPKLSSSKKKIPSNQITLNNQVIKFNENSSSKYWPPPQIPTAFDSYDTAEKLTKIMKEIQECGGPKYYKKPLKLLKQKIRDKTWLKTDTSLNLEDSYALLQRSIEDIEEIDIEGHKSLAYSEFPNQSQVSQKSLEPSYENRAIQTMAGKAYKKRIEVEQKKLKQQRQKDKVKWEKQLQQGREFIKNQINRRYLVINKVISKGDYNSKHF